MAYDMWGRFLLGPFGAPMCPVIPHFTGRRLRTLEPAVATIVTQTVTDLERRIAEEGTVDLVEHFALPVPSLTICGLLGVPYAERDQFQRLSRPRWTSRAAG